MAIAKMSVKDLEAFLLAEFPQAFLSGDISIESADGTTCLLRQRYSDQMLRPGGTVSGPTLMALAGVALVLMDDMLASVVGFLLTPLLSAIPTDNSSDWYVRYLTRDNPS